MPKEYLDKIRAKYPQYGDMNDSTLAAKILTKYPQYQDVLGDMVGQRQAATPTPSEPTYGQRVAQAFSAPGAKLNQSLSELSSNPIAGTAGVFNALSMLPSALLSPVTEANIPVVSEGLKGALGLPTKAASGAVGLGQSAIDLVPLPQSVKNLGMSDDEASKAAEEMHNLNTATAMVLGPKMVSAAVPPIVQSLKGTPTEQFVNTAKSVIPARPKELNYNQRMQGAAPYLKGQQLESPVETVRQAYEAAGKAKQKLFEDTMQPQVESIKGDFINRDMPRQAILGTITDHMKRFEPDKVAQIQQYADNYNQITTVEQANQYLKELNAEPAVKGYYNAKPVDQAAILQTNPLVAAKVAEADGLRQAMMDAFERNGVEGAMEARKAYGNLKFAEDAFWRNVTKSEKSSPFLQRAAGLTPRLIGFTAGYASHQLGGPVGSLATGVAADALATKYLSRYLPNETIARAFKSLEEEGRPPLQYPPIPPFVYPDSSSR